MLSIEGVEMDLDSGDRNLEEVAGLIKAGNIAAMIATSPRHTEAHPKMRVICPTSAPLNPNMREKLCARVQGVLGGSAEPESFTPSQMFYFGRVEGCEPPEARLVEGRAIDEAYDLDAGALDRNGQPYSAQPEHVEAPIVQVGDDDDDDDIQSVPDYDNLKDAAFTIPAVDAGYDIWARLGMALHGATRGSDAGRAIWDGWSAQGKTYNAREIRSKWKSFARSTGPKLGAGTVYHLAMQHGWNAVVETDDVIDPIDSIGEADRTSGAIDPKTARLNRRHSVIFQQGRALVTTQALDGSVNFGTARDLNVFYCNDRVRTATGKTEPVSERWLRDPHRSTYANGVLFAPGGCGPGVLNLWRGWAVEPDAAADCPLFLAHLLEVICSGDVDQYRYVLGWLAHIVQHPDRKPGVALVLKGAKGAGKDTVAEYMTKLIGRRHVPSVAEPEHIVGRFNARLETALLLHVQEGSWAGDRKSEGQLKYIVTSESVQIERKGIDSFPVPSVLRVFISANADWVVPASADERRWAVFNVSNVRRGDVVYFDALRREMLGTGPAALLHYLQHYDLSQFEIRKPPETDGLRDQKVATLRGVEAWWLSRLERGELSLGFEATEA